VSATRADLGSRASQGEDREARIDQQLHELQSRLGATFDQMDVRVADALAEMGSRGADVNAEAAARLSELAGSHEQLSSAVQRLEGQVSATRADLGAGAHRTTSRRRGRTGTWAT
jgi:outer membrane murein-binding lipoprotein Lpp